MLVSHFSILLALAIRTGADAKTKAKCIEWWTTIKS